MITLISVELQKTFRKWRTYIGFLAVFILTLIIHLAFYLAKDAYVEDSTRRLADSFIVNGNFFNGYVIAYLFLNLMFLHIPFLIVLVGGDVFAGEATAGTYRMLLTRPVSRFGLVTSKYLAGLIYTFLFILFIAFMSLGVSLLFFGSGELIAMTGDIRIYASDDVLWRMLGAYGYTILSMMTVMAISIFFSSMVSNAIGPIVTTMAVLFVFLILSAIPVEFLENLQPYFFTTHLMQWKEFFNDPVDYGALFKSSGILVGHIIFFYALTTYAFIKKDILS